MSRKGVTMQILAFLIKFARPLVASPRTRFFGTSKRRHDAVRVAATATIYSLAATHFRHAEWGMLTKVCNASITRD